MTVLITRPKAQSLALANLLTQQGLSVIIFPVVDVAKPTHPLPTITVADISIFISPTTVRALFAQVPDFQADNVFAIGAGTAQCLAEFGIEHCLFPLQESSQGLLAMPALQDVLGQRINIFAGEAGSRTLQEALGARGALVEMLYTHRRVLPKYEAVPWQPSEVDVSICTSSQSLIHLRTLIDQLGLSVLLDKPLVVIKELMIEQARHMGFKSAIIAANGAGNAAILKALQSLA